MSPGVAAFWSCTAVEAARTGEDGLAEEAAARVAESGGFLDLVAFCRCVADVAARALSVLHEPPDLAQGERWALQPNPAATVGQLFAVRLTVAPANRDSDMATALVAAVVEASERPNARSRFGR
ncbi:hypothetical protein [Streptomyces californicus]|uniref:hypothetical protein n=1 Tax=Streptomyces californicus TaxID=67351 RepID=UPI00382D39AC